MPSPIQRKPKEGLCSAVSMSFAIFLIFGLGEPYAGVFKVPPTAL
jgi:hypothetical protein